ncbi:MAG: hypothetical protein HYV52_00825 [Parcubacteria group bacterium]|nr:hypothetical protein [Parcubacteria group bacterium]
MLLQDISITFTTAFTQLLNSVVVEFLPRLILAIVVFIIGWIVAMIFDRVIIQIFRSLKVDQYLAKLGFEKPIERAGMKLDSGRFVGGIVKWFFIVVFLLTAANILNLSAVADFLQEVIAYLPHVFVAAIILLVAALVADFVAKTVKAAVDAAGLASGPFLSGVVKWAIWIFAIFATLLQLGVARDILSTFFTGFVAFLAIAGGIAFGLGGKEQAASFIEKLRRDISEKR